MWWGTDVTSSKNTNYLKTSQYKSTDMIVKMFNLYLFICVYTIPVIFRDIISHFQSEEFWGMGKEQFYFVCSLSYYPWDMLPKINLFPRIGNNIGYCSCFHRPKSQMTFQAKTKTYFQKSLQIFTMSCKYSIQPYR